MCSQSFVSLSQARRFHCLATLSLLQEPTLWIPKQGQHPFIQAMQLWFHTPLQLQPHITLNTHLVHHTTILQVSRECGGMANERNCRLLPLYQEPALRRPIKEWILTVWVQLVLNWSLSQYLQVISHFWN